LPFSNGNNSGNYGSHDERTLIAEKFDSLQERFYSEVASMVAQPDTSYIDLIIHWAKTNGIQVESCSEWILKDPAMLVQVQAAAESLRFLKPVRRVKI
jgi:hypothetical protein